MATTIGDIVLMHIEGEPAFFARIEDITADHKPDWWHVHLLLLNAPLAETVIILREEYINGEDFTMGGKEMRMEKVVAPSKAAEGGEASQEPKALPKGKVVSLADRKK